MRRFRLDRGAVRKSPQHEEANRIRTETERERERERVSAFNADVLRFNVAAPNFE